MTEQTKGLQCPRIKARQNTAFDRKSENGCMPGPYRSRHYAEN